MRENNIIPKTVKKFNPTTNSNHNYPVAPNLLNRNFNIDKPAQTYVTHRSTTENENKEIFAKWNNVGLPDVVIGRCGVTRAFPDINVDDYVAVAEVHEYMTFKFEKSENYITIYVTKDLFNKIGTLEELTAQKLY